MTHLFVYGTLMRGYGNHRIVEPYVVSCRRAYLRGRLYHLPAGYPMLFPGDDVVEGELLELRNPEEALRHTDQLEGYDGERQSGNLYDRVTESAFLGNGRPCECIVYRAPEGAALPADAVLLPHGSWNHYRRTGHENAEDTVLYFAYGSCMDPEDFSRSVKEFHMLGKAVAEGECVEFLHWSKGRDCGTATLRRQEGRTAEGRALPHPGEAD